MKPNKNFDNQFEITIEPINRDKALSFFKKVSINRPGVMDKANLKLIDQIDGRLTITLDNTPVIDKDMLKIMRKYLYSLRSSS